MKTVKTMACFMAMIMASSVVLVSCKKDKEKEPEVQQTAETPQGKNEVVKTQFAISMPSQLKNGANRMPATTVQKKGMEQFQGMTGITLIPFAKPGKITGSDFRLGANIELDPLAKSEVDTKANQAKVYQDVDIPLTTASFLFYAKSAASGTKFEVGSLVASDLTDQPSTFQFGLEPIRTDVSAMMAATGHGGKLMAYLTSIANASDGTKAWYETEDAAMAALFTTFSSLHGLSSAEVERVLTDLNKSLKPLRAHNTLADSIATAIANGTYATVTSDEVELVSELDNFPAEYDLPQGCIDVKWDAGSHSFIEGLYSNMADPSTFTYPAQLWYYVNSTIKTSNTSQQTAYANTTNSWDDILALHTAPTNVNSLTRAVAIKDKIQYAVARFDVTVKLDAASLADRSQEAVGIATAVNASAGFPVTAVLVGGQQSVKFDFTSTASGTELTIYDNTMTGGGDDYSEPMMATTAASSVNHTLVLENGTQDVRVAVEMVNTTGVDFYGANDQLIPAGGKFYVVAELDATKATETAGHVFKQDYTTTANLTLKNLKTAYNTIPDLRTPKLELGFSVDLSWKAGHTYNIDFQ